MPMIDQPSRKTRNSIIAVAGAVLLVGGGGAYWMYYQAQAATRNFNQAVSLADERDLNAQYKNEASGLQQYVNTKPPVKYSNQILLKLATAYLNAGENDQAVTAYKLANAADPTRRISAITGLALAYANLGEKQTAIDYYNQAIAIVKAANKPDAQVDIDRYNAEIKLLQAAK